MYFLAHFQFFFLVGSLVLTLSSSFLAASRPPGGFPAVCAPCQGHSFATPRQVPFPSTALRLVLDPPMKGDEKKKGEGDDENSSDDWIPSEGGGFILRIRARLGLLEKPVSTRRSSEVSNGVPAVKAVIDIQQYKKEVVEVRDQIVCVRFYAPWCKSCKSIEASFRRLPRDFPGAKFVEVPVLKDNAYLLKGLGVPSLPFGHIYHPDVGLVDERKINKNMFADFKQELRTYVHGECRVQYDDLGNCIPL